MHWLQSAGGLEGGWLNRVHTHTYTCHVFYPWTVVLNVEGSDGDMMVSWHSTVWYIDCLRHVHLRDQSLTRSEEIGRVFFFYSELTLPPTEWSTDCTFHEHRQVHLGSYIHKCSTHDYFFLSTCRPFELSCNTCTWNLINTFIITAIHQQPVHFFTSMTVGLQKHFATFWIIAFLGSFHLPNIYRAVFPSLDITHSLTVDYRFGVFDFNFVFPYIVTVLIKKKS